MKVPIQIYVHMLNGEKQFVAYISDGWWIARGKTKEEAIRRVIDKLIREVELI